MSSVVTLLLVVNTTLAAEEFHLEFEAASPTVLGNPHDLILDESGTRLLVSDVSNNRIAVLDANTLELLGSFADGELSAPHDIALGPGNRVYVADTGNNRIAIYELNDLNARLAGELKGRIRNPEGVAVDGNGRVFASGAGSGNVVLFDQSGDILAEATGFRSPHDVAITHDGQIWLADASNNRIVRLDARLDVQAVLQGSPYDFNGPRYLDIASNGQLFIADKYAHQIKITDSDGTLVHVLGSGWRGKGEDVFTTPEGVALRGDLAWFSDSGNNRVVRYRVHGSP